MPFPGDNNITVVRTFPGVSFSLRSHPNIPPLAIKDSTEVVVPKLYTPPEGPGSFELEAVADDQLPVELYRDGEGGLATLALSFQVFSISRELAILLDRLSKRAGGD